MDCALKFVGNSDTEIEGLLMPFGGLMNGRDLDGECFSKNTDFCLDLYQGPRPLMFHHGMDPKVEAKAVGQITSIDMTDDGGWMRGWLDKRSKFYDSIKQMIGEKALELSSGAMPHLVRKNANTGEILRWPVTEGSLTPTPANPMLAYVDFADAKAHFKSAQIDVDFDEVKARLDAAAEESDPEGVKAAMDASQRDALSDSDFAYIDSDGKRSLPINDEAHVRAAMSRWNQTSFESDSAKAAAKRKIIARAKKLGIEVGDFASSKAADDATLDALADDTPDTPATKSMEGSYEDLIEDLTALLNPQSPFGPQGYSCIVATFPDHVIVSRYDYGGDADDGQTYWSVQYSVGDDGEPTLGVAAQVEQTYVPAKSYLSDSPLSLDATILGRHAGALAQRTKDLHRRRIAEGRVLSTSNRNSLADAVKTLGSSQSEIKSLIDASDQLGRDQAEASARLRPDARQRRLAALSLCIDEERQTA